MCTLVPLSGLPKGRQMDLTPGVEYPDVSFVHNMEYSEKWVYQCWHPETGEWSTMPLTVDGMAWTMPPGSKIRVVAAEDAPAPEPTMVEQLETVV